MTNSPIVLEVRGLAAGYGDIGVIEDVHLTAWAGRATAVFGANGAGKTTLLSTIAGLVGARAGSVVLDGHDITKRPAYSRSGSGLALVQEGKRVLRKRTVQENLRLGGYQMSRADRAAAIDVAYDRFPILREKRDFKAGALSGGQQQMLAIAQALMPGPKVLLLDEPSAGLAPIIVTEMLHSIAQLKSEGTAVVLVEQLVGQAMSVADHVVALQDGRVVIDSPATEVDNERLQAAYLGTSTAEARDNVPGTRLT